MPSQSSLSNLRLPSHTGLLSSRLKGPRSAAHSREGQPRDRFQRSSTRGLTGPEWTDHLQGQREPGAPGPRGRFFTQGTVWSSSPQRCSQHGLRRCARTGVTSMGLPGSARCSPDHGGLSEREAGGTHSGRGAKARRGKGVHVGAGEGLLLGRAAH